MKVVLSGHEEKAKCVWCMREKETVKASFSDRMFTNAAICWKCLATIVRVKAQDMVEPSSQAVTEKKE
jgi:hypothetical protein